MTPRSDAWTEYELQVLYELVNCGEWFAQAQVDLPGRSESAIRCKMNALRREAGIIPKPGPTAAARSLTVRQQAAAGSEKLREAILREVVHA